MYEIDHRNLTNWSKAVGQASGNLKREMSKTTNAGAGRGVEYAVGNLDDHRVSGNLAGSIHITKKATPDDWHAAFGSVGIEYAWQKERGGVIRARNKPYLHFKVNGHWVKVKSVRQKAIGFMSKAHRRLWPELRQGWQNAIDRGLKDI